MEEEAPGDASTLIYLAKANAFPDATRCVRTILVPPSVWREAVEEGERVGAREVPRIRAAVEANFLRRIDLSESEQRFAATIAAENRLGIGESEVLAAARRFALAVVDEGRGTRVARALGIVPVSTIFLPVLGRRARTLTLDEAVDFLRRLAVVTGVRSDVATAIEDAIRKE